MTMRAARGMKNNVPSSGPGVMKPVTVSRLFWSPAANGSVGFSVGESVGSAEGGFSLSYSGTYYQQIWPYGRVWF